MDERPLLSEQDPPSAATTTTTTSNINTSTDHALKDAQSDRFFLMICLCFFCTVIMLESWLSAEPTWPISEFQVNSLSLTNFSISSYQSLTANWNVSFQIYNPMRFEIPYREVNSIVSYKSRMLSQARSVPFKHDNNHKVTSTLNMSISAVESYVEGWVLHGIYRELRNGSVSFNLTMVTDYGYFRRSRFPRRPHLLRVVCEDVVVAVSMNSDSGYLIDGPTKCSSS